MQQVELKDINLMEHEIRQAKLDFGQSAPTTTGSFSEAQPLHYNSEQDVIDLENQPAYLRQRNQTQTQQQTAGHETAAQQAPQMSHLTLSSDGKLRENNAFLFDNVD